MRITERTLFVDDVEAAAAFYEKLLGTPPAYRGKGIAVFHAGEVD
ncbi:MAG: VOC family protein, partial [Planctomycetota bacterium]